MALIAIGVTALCVLIFGIVRAKRLRERRELEKHCIEPETLHALIDSGQKVLVLDVRQPLDLLAYSEIIPGARRIPPKEVIENPSLVPRDENSVLYCTCNSEKTSRDILRRALALKFTHVKILKGGLAAGKGEGYSVEGF